MIALFNRGLQIAIRESGQQASVIRSMPDKRGYFSSRQLDIRYFQAITEKLEKNEAISLDKLRANIEEAITKPGTFLPRLDVDNFLHLAKTDSDLELGSKAVHHLNTRLNRMQRLMLGSAVARAYYVQNKTDKAIELYHNKESKTFDAPDLAGLILLNKLVEDKRYDDAISFYDKVVDNRAAELDKKKLIGYLELYLEALLEKNTPEALQKAKAAAEAFKAKLTFDKLRNALFKLILLAINQNDTAYALELISAVKKEDRIESNRIFVNLKMIALLKNNQADEFLKEADVLKGKQFKEEGKTGLYFAQTIEQVKSVAESVTDESLKKSLAEIAQSSGDKLIADDLKSAILKSAILIKKPEGGEQRARSANGSQRNNQNNNQRRPNQSQNNRNYNNNYNNNNVQSRRNDGGFQNRDRNDGYNNRRDERYNNNVGNGYNNRREERYNNNVGNGYNNRRDERYNNNVDNGYNNRRDERYNNNNVGDSYVSRRSDDNFQRYRDYSSPQRSSNQNRNFRSRNDEDEDDQGFANLPRRN